VYWNIAWKRVEENNTQLISWHWVGDDESMFPIVTLIIHMTIFSIVNTEITSLPDPSRKFRDLWVCWEKANADGSPYYCNVNSVFNPNTGVGLIKAAMKFSNPALFVWFIIAKKQTAQLVPTCLGMVAPAMFLWMSSTYLQPSI
jgi:hypothetical protein